MGLVIVLVLVVLLLLTHLLKQFLLLLLGPFTCGLSWIGVVILAFASEPRFRRLESGCRTPLQIRNSRIAAQDSGGLDV